MHFTTRQCMYFLQYDLKNRKLFLRTSLKEDIALQDFYIGNSLNVCGRKLCIVDYGDEWTRKKLSSKIERFYFSFLVLPSRCL